MPTPIRRRDFLKLLSLGVGALACRISIRPVKPTATPTPPASATRTASATSTPASPTTASPPPQASSTQAASTQAPASATPPDLPFPPVIIDGHQDIAWNALEFGRDLRQSAFDTRLVEAASGLSSMIGERTTGLPEYLAGRVGIVFATLFVLPAASAYPGYNKMTYSTPEQAEKRARQQLEYYNQLADQEPQLRIVRSVNDLEVVVSTWKTPEITPVVGLVLLMEGADPILTPDDLGNWYQGGLRLVGPAWHGTRYSGGTGDPGPLTALGRKLLAAMAKFNMILDLSHLAEAAYLEAIDTYSGPMIASHSNPRTFLPGDRGLSDKMIRKLAARNGVVGIVLYNRYLNPNWRHGMPRDLVTLDTVVEAIDHVVQLTGDARYAALGSDFDGGFGLDAIPQGMDSIADIEKIAAALERRGYGQADVAAVMYGNWLRVLQDSLPT